MKKTIVSSVCKAMEVKNAPSFDFNTMTPAQKKRGAEGFKPQGNVVGNRSMREMTITYSDGSQSFLTQEFTLNKGGRNGKWKTVNRRDT